jgi:hypothetical protein
MADEQKPLETKNNTQTEADPDQPIVYQIRLKSHLDSNWADWFEGLTITLEEAGYTLLTGPIVDQAALYALLKKVRDLGMPLISVQYLEAGQAGGQESREITL